MRIDMHLHTSASDGTWSPSQLVEEARDKKLDIFAVTDHDTVESLSETQALADRSGLFFLPGIEVSSTLNGRLFHILGYGIDADDPGLLRLAKENSRLMMQKDNDSIRRLIEHGYNIDYEDFLHYRNDASKGGWKALNFLIERGICQNAAEFFDKIFIDLNDLSFPKFASPEEVIETIVKAHGVPVLAHPGINLYGNKHSLGQVLQEFYAQGIQGIEVFHTQHNDEQTKTCYDWALRKGLQVTGGSDCHGGFIPHRKLGFPEVYVEKLKVDKILKRL